MRKSHAAVGSDWEPTAARPVKYSHLSWKSKFYYHVHKRSPVYLTHFNSVTSFENSFAIFPLFPSMPVFFKTPLSLMTTTTCAFQIFTMSITRLLDFISLIYVILDEKKNNFPAMLLLLPRCQVTSCKGTHSTHLGGSIVLYTGKSKTVRYLSKRICPCDGCVS